MFEKVRVNLRRIFKSKITRDMMEFSNISKTVSSDLDKEAC